MDPALVVLAAGLGARFGGGKELAAVGPNGEAFLDYTIFDALRFGYRPIVLVVRSTARHALEAHLAEHGLSSASVVYVAQDLDQLVPERAKPWGTVHAVLAARAVLSGPFAVANADDLYGPGSLKLLAQRLQEAATTDRQQLIAFELGKTLSPTGAVNRGVCDAPGGVLRAVREVRGIEPDTALAPDTLVSMNLWGFSAAMLPRLEAQLARFVSEHPDDAAAEDLLPDAVGEMVSAAEIAVDVDVTSEQWVGVTYQADLEWARGRVAALIAAGAYPASLHVALRESKRGASGSIEGWS